MRHNETVAAPFALLQFIQRYHTQEKNSVHDFYEHKASIYSEKTREEENYVWIQQIEKCALQLDSMIFVWPSVSMRKLFFNWKMKQFCG